MSSLKKRTALVVLSGGQDSTTCLFWAKENFDEVHAVSFDYGQRHRIELDAAVKVAELAGVASHEIVKLGKHLLLSASPLTSDSALDEYRSFSDMEAEVGDRVEKTFVPMRNTVFLTIAANRAVALGCGTIVTGICAQDNANYPDCRDVFAASTAQTINLSLGTEREAAANLGGIGVAAPLLHLTKAQSVAFAGALPGCMHALAYSHTSYDGKYPPVGANHSNLLRAEGFKEANQPDPLVIRAWLEGLMELPLTPNYEFYRAMGAFKSPVLAEQAPGWMWRLANDVTKENANGA